MKAYKWQPSPATDRRIHTAYDAFTRLHDRRAIGRAAVELGVPKWVINRRAKYLGLARTKEKAWSREELDLLRGWRFYSAPEICRRLRERGYGRSETAVIVKRKRLAITSRNHVDGYTGRALASLLNIDSHAIRHWIDKGLLRAERRQTCRTVSQGGDGWWIRREDVRVFIFTFPEQLDLRKVDAIWFIELLKEGCSAVASGEEEYF